MKYHQTLDSILGQKSKLRVLRVLADNTLELTGREIARSTKLAQRIVHHSLLSLFSSGIVLMRKSGRSKLYKLNRNNILVEKGLIPLFVIEKSLLKLIVGKIKKKTFGVLSIILFGSVAKGKERDDSDIDLLIVLSQSCSIEKTEKRMDDLNFEISKKFGNGLSPVLLKRNDLKKRYKKGNNFIRNIAEDALVLYGKTILELVYEP